MKASYAVNGVELIDTLWNVNLDKNNMYYPNHHELIDTLWNVNFSSAM